jgi:tetratricopeptide (TPR) repeat protein
MDENECRPAHVKGRAALLPLLDSTICEPVKAPGYSPMFYPEKAMPLVPIVCAGMLIQAAAGQTGAVDAASALREGSLAQEHGDLNTAIADFRRALALKPDSIEARVNLGAALAAAGQLDAAIEEDSHVLELSPQNDTVRMNLAMAYYRTGNWNQARVEFERLHAAHPSDLSTAILLGYTLNKLNRSAEAVALLAPMEAAHGDDYQFEYVYAYALIGSGKQDEGLPRMEKLAKAKKSAEAWLLAGSARYYRDEMEIACADLDAAMELNPKLPGLYRMSGQARYAMKNFAGAETSFQAALRADPMDFVANRDLGAMRLKANDIESARPLLELALQLHPDDPLTRLEIAKLNDQTGKYAEAAAILEDLVRTDPNWLDPHWLLAAVYSELNRPADGKKEREIAEQIRIRQKAQKQKSN